MLFSYVVYLFVFSCICILSPVLYIALHVIRIFSIGIFFPILKKLGYGITFNEILFVTFAGLRGAIGLGLGLAIFRQKDEYFPVEVKSVFIIEIGMIVLMTLFINANLIPKLLVHLKLLVKSLCFFFLDFQLSVADTNTKIFLTLANNLIKLSSYIY